MVMTNAMSNAFAPLYQNALAGLVKRRKGILDTGGSAIPPIDESIAPREPTRVQSDAEALAAPPMAMPSVTPPDLTANVPEVQRPGILGGLKQALQDPELRAALFRSGAQTLATGNIGQGFQAGAELVDQRRRLRDENARQDRDFGLRERGVKADERRSDATIRQGDDRNNIDREQVRNTRDYQTGQLRNQRYGIDVDSADRRTGYGVQERSNIRDNATRAAGDQLQYRATTDAAKTRATASAMPSPSETKGILAMVLPSVYRGVEGFDDEKHMSQAIQANPELYAQLSDAAATGYQNGGTSGAVRAAKGVLDRYTYAPFKDRWFGLPDKAAVFEPRPMEAKQPVAQKAPAAQAPVTQAPAIAAPYTAQAPQPRSEPAPAVSMDIRYGPDGRAYRRGQHGEAVLVPAAVATQVAKAKSNEAYWQKALEGDFADPYRRGLLERFLDAAKYKVRNESESANFVRWLEMATPLDRDFRRQVYGETPEYQAEQRKKRVARRERDERILRAGAQEDDPAWITPEDVDKRWKMYVREQQARIRRQTPEMDQYFEKK